MRASGAGAVEHLGRGDIMDGAAEWAHGVGVEVGEGGELFGGLLIGKWVVENGLFRYVREADVFADVVEVGAIVLPHEEELTAVAENGGPDAAFLEPRVLLHDGDVPAVELAHLCVALFHDLFASRDV